MKKTKPTSGIWVVMPGISRPRICIDGDPEWPIVTVSAGPDEKQIKANEQLIAEAGTVHHKTGLTPRQLLAQRKILLKACKRLIDAPHQEHFAARLNDEEMEGIDAIKDAIAKVEGRS